LFWGCSLYKKDYTIVVMGLLLAARTMIQRLQVVGM
jgi:hypothetical protein